MISKTLACVGLFLASTICLSDEAHWHLIYKKGTVETSVDTVRTGKDSSAIIALASGSLLKLNERSEVALSNTPKDDVIQLRSGGVFSDVSKKKEKHFYIKTPSATLGVRGTKFFTAFSDDGSAPKDVWMCVQEGQVAVQTPDGGSEVLVREGQGVLVPEGKPPTEPKVYEWTKHLNWNMDPKHGDVMDKTSMKSGYHDLKKQNYD